MKPLYPALVAADELNAMKWAEHPENRAFKNYLLATCQEFPSIVLAAAGRPGLNAATATLAESLIAAGINVFMPENPAPICALSQAVSSRSMPMAIYLDGDETCQNLSLTALTRHGGPPDEKDVLEYQHTQETRTGVAGITELDRYYTNNISGLADRFIEKGAGYSSFKIPFPALEDRMRAMPELAILFECDPTGPEAIVSNDGQSLLLKDKNGVVVAAAEIVQTVVNYLVKERLASGTVVGPERLTGLPENITNLQVEGSPLDMSYHAGFADLLIGWWHDGTMAHQGSSCFGDAILTAIYYLEAMRCKS